MKEAVRALAITGSIALWLAFGSMLSSAAAAPVLPSGFQDSVMPFEGLTPGQGLEEPTAFRFAPDGKVFVAEKSGKILVYDSLADHTPTLFADLRTEVYNANDRGLLGLALDPKFDEGHPYVYVLYAYDHQLGEEAPPPRWGNPDEDGDGCPEPPGANTDGCVISGRLSRLTANLATDKETEEKPLITDWCQQFSSHSVGDLQFDSKGNLWVSGGEGAAFNKVDWGQYGYPQVNPCGDPPAGVGGLEEPPSAEGGALRSQNSQKLGGKLIRVNPETGEGVPENPLALSLNANERRIVGKGFRNPFRFTIAPGTNEVYVDNVGSSVYEEIDRFSPSSNEVFNSGWPCYEGPERRELYEFRGLTVCEQLYETPGSTAQPFFYYSHNAGVTPEDPCPYEPGSAISGLAFYEGGSYPAAYDGALFFADSVRGCIYVMRAGEDGRPAPSKVEPFLTEGGLYPGVDIEVGPSGDLYYANLFGKEFGPGAIHQISYEPEAPQAQLKADRTSGATPLEVHFDAGESSDPQNQELEYEWDLDGNGTFGPPTKESTATESYATPENRTAAVRVVDPDGHSSVAQVTIYPGDTPPQPHIEEPSDGLRWAVGQHIQFKGKAKDGAGEPLEKSHLYWRARLYHCPGGPESCHAHPLEVFPAVESGELVAPDHDLPSHIELTLTATDARGLSASETVSLYPNVSFLGMRSEPPGVTLSAGLQTEATPFGVEAIEGSQVEVSAPATVEIAGTTYTWRKWSDGGARVHQIVAQPGATNYVAEYAGPEGKGTQPPSPQPAPPGPPAPGPTAAPPTVSITAHPGKRTHSARARYAFSADQSGSSFKCKLDSGSFKACRSPQSYKHLRPGPHTFTVVAVGPGGQGAPARFSWKVLPKPKRR
jgi:glucose/arabinose dehydrogenase